MNLKRIEMLKERIQSEPKDPFFIYALSLEYKESDPKKSIDILMDCQCKFPDYLPLYYQLGELLTTFGETEKAMEIYDLGIVLAKKHSEFKTLAELNNAKQNMIFNED